MPLLGWRPRGETEFLMLNTQRMQTARNDQQFFITVCKFCRSLESVCKPASFKKVESLICRWQWNIDKFSSNSNLFWFYSYAKVFVYCVIVTELLFLPVMLQSSTCHICYNFTCPNLKTVFVILQKNLVITKKSATKVSYLTY